MNTAPCPDCQNQVSFSAVSCPKCGRVMQPGDLPKPASQTSEQRSKTKQASRTSAEELQSKTNIGCLIAVAILFALMAFCCVASKQSPEDVDREFQKTLEWERKRGDYR
ncbi:MAG: hypothetical protein H0X72_02525 [Acidobacteria bacterium]|nr:hypothetical protein [Acidobacteriota bacterium]